MVCVGDQLEEGRVLVEPDHLGWAVLVDDNGFEFYWNVTYNIGDDEVEDYLSQFKENGMKIHCWVKEGF